ncbi:MAG: hypothetical protein WEB58_01805 [Planctomycetaceae bacterium]
MKSSSQNVEVDWALYLPADAAVTYSDLCIPDVRRKESDRNVAEIVLASGLAIDVEWRMENDHYIVTLFDDDYEKPFERVVCHEVDQVIEAVSKLAHGDHSHHDSPASMLKMPPPRE